MTTDITTNQAETDLKKALAELDQVTRRRTDATEALKGAELNRKNLAVAAAMGDAAAQKKLKAATFERNDAAQLVEDIETAISRAHETVDACRQAILKKQNILAISELATLFGRRIALWEQSKTSQGDLYAAYNGLSSTFAPAMALLNKMSPHIIAEVVPGVPIDQIRYLLGKDYETFGVFMAETMPPEVFKHFPEQLFAPRRPHVDVELELLQILKGQK